MLPGEQVVHELKTFEPGGTQALTLYLAPEPGRDTAATLEIQLAELLRHLEEGEAGGERHELERDVEAARAFIARLTWFPRGLAIFSCAARGFLRAIPLPVRFRPEAVRDRRFELRQLVSALTEHDRVLVLLLDKEKARFFAVMMGEIEEFEDLWDYLPAKQHGGETGGRRQLDGDREVHVLLHVRHVLNALERIDARAPARRILVGGPEEVVAAFERLLPKQLRARVHTPLRVPVYATPRRVLEVVREASRVLDREAEERVVAELFSEGHSRTALGVREVVEAVNEKRVRQLILTEAAHVPGSACDRCNLVFLDPQGSACPVCGERPRRVPDVIGALVSAVLRQDGNVRELREEAALRLDAHGGIAARLRYSRPRVLTA